MFIWDFVADTVLGQILDWIYGQTGSVGVFGGLGIITSPIMMLFILIMMGYAVIKVFFANLKRGGILLIQIAVGVYICFLFPVDTSTVLLAGASRL